MTKEYVSRKLHSLSNLIMRYFDNSPIKKSLDQVTGTNGWIIGYLADHDDRVIYQKDLEKEFGITRSTASKVVNRMEQKGLIRRECVAEDARLRKLSVGYFPQDGSGSHQSGAEADERLLRGRNRKTAWVY